VLGHHLGDRLHDARLIPSDHRQYQCGRHRRTPPDLFSKKRDTKPAAGPLP
jgi:hypothetical protein